MMRAPTGIISDNVVTTTIQLSGAAYQDWRKVEQFYTALLGSARQQPGIDSVGASTMLALEAGWRQPYRIEGRPAPREGEALISQHISVSTGYFETACARLMQGRFFQDSDSMTGEPVIVVNQAFARRTFPGEEAVGKPIVTTAQQIGPLGKNLPGLVPFRIVGVVADIQQAPIGRRSEPVIYHTQRQFPFRAMTLVGRGADTATVVAGLRAAVRGLDVASARQRANHGRTIRGRDGGPRLLTGVLVTFGVLTAALAAIGVYGLLAWTVSDRRRELAIRLALGAQPGALAPRHRAGPDAGRARRRGRSRRRAVRARPASRRAVRNTADRPPGTDDRSGCPGAGGRCRLFAPALRATRSVRSRG